MNSLFFDSTMADQDRRKALYDGQIFVYSPNRSSRELCQLAHALTLEAFAPMDPKIAQHELPVEKYAAILQSLKPKFIHHPRAKKSSPSC